MSSVSVVAFEHIFVSSVALQKGHRYEFCESFVFICQNTSVRLLNPFVPMHLFLPPFLMFSEGRERVHWEQMG